jgi:hypothetical protein
MIWVKPDRLVYENKEYCENDCLLCYSKTLCSPIKQLKWNFIILIAYFGGH